MRQKINIDSLSGTDKEKTAVLLNEIALLRDLKKGAASDVREELRAEITELVDHVNGIINQGKTTIKTQNHN